MKLLKNILCFVMAAVLTVCLAACANGDQKPGQPSVDANADVRAPYVAEGTGTFAYTEDTDGDFEYKEVDWEGPAGYVIVVPAGNSEAKASAETLQRYFTDFAGVTLSIVTDNTAVKDKEILVGKTSRYESDNTLAENKLKVSVVEKKLVFDGGHDVTVDSAVKKFTNLTYQEGKAYTFAVDTDFYSTLKIEGMEDYVYVWGDEFEEATYDDINWSKWGLQESMSGTTNIMISTDRSVIDIGKGRLQLYAINYYNIENSQYRYVVPWAVSTNQTMNYVYGYAEIRAKVPYLKGVWPSWWGNSNAGTGKCSVISEYFTEVDIFEIFGSDDQVAPNLHKWYKDLDYAATYNLEDNVQHTSAGTDNNYNFKKYQDIANLSNEYHTYGFYWTPKEMSMYVDGTKYQSYDITKSWDEYDNMKGFNDPMMLMFNCHVMDESSSFAANSITENVDVLPAEYFIDYFRIYQKPGEGKVYTNTTPTQEERPLEYEAERR